MIKSIQHLLIFVICAGISSCSAELTSSQVDARRIATKQLANILREASTKDGNLGLSVQEIETIIGRCDTKAKSNKWKNSETLTYRLSNGRWFEVDSSNNGIYQAIISDGKTNELVYK